MGAGYVGMALLKHLQNASKQPLWVTTTQADKASLLSQYAQHVLVLDPAQEGALETALGDCDGMIILVAPKNNQTYAETYLGAVKRVLHALKHRDRPFHIIYTSSTSVYEGVDAELALEEVSVDPHAEQGKILVEAEKLVLSQPGACVLRLGGIFGPGRELSKRARHFSGKEVPGTGKEPTNHIHVDDIVEAICFAFEHKLKGIYNLVNDDHPMRESLYADLCYSLGLAPPTWRPDLPSKKGYKVSNHKIKQAGFAYPMQGLGKSMA